jgi:hypothetical protein
MTNNTLHPKMITAAIAAGINASITSNIIRDTDSLDLIWGEAETINVLSIPFPPNLSLIIKHRCKTTSQLNSWN